MKLVGMPADKISGMRHVPVWPMLEALDPTLAYDRIGVMGGHRYDTDSAGCRLDHTGAGDERERELSLHE
jgi:hypothetical protein